jgi:hypothetical protein
MTTSFLIPGTSNTATTEAAVKCLACKNFPMYSTFKPSVKLDFMALQKHFKVRNILWLW